MTLRIRHAARNLLAAASILAAASAGHAATQADQLETFSYMTCAGATQTLPEAQRLEMLVELTYHALSTQGGVPAIGRAASAQLGLLIEEACRQNPTSSVRDAVNLAIAMTFETPARKGSQLAYRAAD